MLLFSAYRVVLFLKNSYLGNLLISSHILILLVLPENVWISGWWIFSFKCKPLLMWSNFLALERRKVHVLWLTACHVCLLRISSVIFEKTVIFPEISRTEILWYLAKFWYIDTWLLPSSFWYILTLSCEVEFKGCRVIFWTRRDAYFYQNISYVTSQHLPNIKNKNTLWI